MKIATLAEVEEKAAQWKVSFRETEIKLLEKGIIPERYLRNIGTLGIEGQIKLRQSAVGVVGAGGLGGTVLELLARLGIGKLVCIDGDVFAGHNLNRQILSAENNLGQSKVEAARMRIASINKGVEVQVLNQFLTKENSSASLRDCQVVVDALDNLADRFLLEEAAKCLGIPLVHGAIAGFTGQVTTIFPEDQGLTLIYQTGRQKGIEQELGNPATTPALTAAYQVQEVVKILTGKGTLLRNKLLYFDGETGVTEIFHLA